MRRDRFEFEGLVVFRKAVDLVEEVDRMVSHFQGHRRSTGLQMYDSATSIALNVAESRRRTTRADRARFLDIANGSASETAGALCIADRLEVGPEPARTRIRSLLHEIMAMLSTMTRTLRRGPTGP
jgi:four helix bundle protein